MSRDTLTVRSATPEDVAAICDFGAAHIPEHYRPLIGPEAAEAQVTQWWSEQRIGASVAAGLLVVAEERGTLVGVAEWGEWDGAPVMWKLYVHPDHRGRGIGPLMINALIGGLPPDADQLHVEHFAANERAGNFYERLGFRHLRTEEGSGAPIVWRALDL